MKTSPIGIFDSGVGGLTVLKKLEEILPQENFLYFGDTAHVPYGEKTPQQLFTYVRQIMEWFKSRNVKSVVMACNTSSATVFENIKDDYDFPVFSLIEPAARYAAYLNMDKIGVIATTATVNSKAYTRAIKRINPGVEVLETACPGLVEIVESNRTETQEARKLLVKYVVPMQQKGCKKIIMGCTHYPFLTPVIRDITGDNELLVDPAVYLADEVADTLMEMDILNAQAHGLNEFFVSSNAAKFTEAGKKIYPNLKEVSEIALEEISSGI